MGHYDDLIENEQQPIGQVRYVRATIDYSDDAYLDFCDTEKQREAFMACRTANGNQTAAGNALGISRSTIKSSIAGIKRRAEKAGYSPEHDMTKPCPDGFRLKGTSTLYKDGKVSIQWVKTDVDNERRMEMMEEAINAMADSLPRIAPTTAPSNFSSELMAIYPLGDPHIGMMAWGEESGEDWDLKIAEEKFCSVFDRLIRTAPACEECTIVNLGDFFHSDNIEGVTSRSKHSLDMDGRYAKMIRVGVKIIRQMIESALSVHAKVRVINAVGNHDDTGSLFLAVCLGNIYENEPRVTVDQSPTPFHYFKWGSSLFGVHHGHTCKAEKLPMVMATDQPKMWGESEFRTWLTGHIHHDTKKEYSGCDVESFRTLAAKDAYAAWGGYRARQDSKCLVIHREYGEIERHTVNIKMV